jgi:hypothetical protein
VAIRVCLRAGIVQFSPLELPFGTTTPPAVAFLVAMVNPAQETSWGLLAVDLSVAEPLAALQLCEASLDFVCFELYNEVGKGEDLLTSESVRRSLGTGTRKLWLLNRQVRGVWSPFASSV